MRFGFIGFLLVALLLGGVWVVAYDAGSSTGAAEAAIADGAAVVYQPAGFSPFGAILGVLFLFLLFGFVMKAIAFRRWSSGGAGAWGRHGAMGHGPDHDDVPERFRPMLDGWHRRSHGGSAEAADAGTTTGAASTDRTDPTGGSAGHTTPTGTAPSPAVAPPPPPGAWTWDPSAPPAGAWTWDPNATPPPPPAGPAGQPQSGPVRPPSAGGPPPGPPPADPPR